MKWEHETWRKLYVRIEASWLALPVSARGLGDELLKYADDEGVIPIGNEAPGAAVARIVSAHPNERKRVNADVADLLKDGFLVAVKGGLVIRNLPAAQSRRGSTGGTSSSAERMARLREKRRGDQDEPRVYFVQGTDKTRVKIGTTENLGARIYGLSHELGQPIECLHHIPGDVRVERAFHERFASLRLTGEWFRLDGELADFLNGATVVTLDDAKLDARDAPRDVTPSDASRDDQVRGSRAPGSVPFRSEIEERESARDQAGPETTAFADLIRSLPQLRASDPDQLAAAVEGQRMPTGRKPAWVLAAIRRAAMELAGVQGLSREATNRKVLSFTKLASERDLPKAEEPSGVRSTFIESAPERRKSPEEAERKIAELTAATAAINAQRVAGGPGR